MILNINTHKFLFIAIMFCAFASQAQVGIGTTSPDANAVLHVKNENADLRGLLVPEYSSSLVGQGSTKAGLLIYSPNMASHYFDNGTNWLSLSPWKLPYNASETYTLSNVSIGANLIPAGLSPVPKLYVSGNTNITGNLELNTNSKISFGGVDVINTQSNKNDIYINSRVLRNLSTVYPDGMWINYNSTGGAAADLRFFANGTTQRMIIDAANGNVGIGTSAPAYKLQVAGDIYADGGWLRVSGNKGIYFQDYGGGFYMTDNSWIRTYNSKNLLIQSATPTIRLNGNSNNGGSAKILLYESNNTNYGMGITYNGAGTGGKLELGRIDSGNEKVHMVIDKTTGNVGIGETSPGYPLTINASSPHTYCCGSGTSDGSSCNMSVLLENGYLYENTPGGCNGLNNRNVSLYASADIISYTGVVVISDARIKNVINQSSSEEDLITLNNIEIVNYSMIDNIANKLTYKKVIAQQVQEFYPIAVGTDGNKTPIPNVFEIAQSVINVSEEQYLINVSKEHKLVVNDMVDLKCYPGNKSILVKVVAINSQTAFTVKTQENLTSMHSVFVYGKEINDLLSVDYDAISMLNVSATQELAKQVELLKKQNSEQAKEIIELKASVAYQTNIKQDIDQLKAQLDILKNSQKLTLE